MAQPTSKRIRIELGRHITRSISDDGWEIIDSAHIETWKAANVLFAKHTFVHRSDEVTLNVDWSRIIRRLTNHLKVMHLLEKTKGTPEFERAVQRFPQSNITVDFYIGGIKGKFNDSYYISLIEYYLYDMFLIMNISSPSSFDLFGLKFPKYGTWRQKIEISNINFDAALLDSFDGSWPRIDFISLEKVNAWFISVRGDIRLIPKNRMEKVLFAIAHISRETYSPTSVIWIFYALETLFDTKAGENFRVLINRISLLLKPNDKQKQHLKRELRELYDLRSSLVHGGLEVTHPIVNEVIDASVDDFTKRIMDRIDFGFRLIIASLQEVIRQGWQEPIFTEILTNKSSSNPDRK